MARQAAMLALSASVVAIVGMAFFGIAIADGRTLQPDGHVCGTMSTIDWESHLNNILNRRSARDASGSTPPGSELPVPACEFGVHSGHESVCDNPGLRDAYTRAVQDGRADKVAITLKVHVFVEDDGSNPLIPDWRTNNELATLAGYYNKFGIFFDAEVVHHRNSTLRYSTAILTDCTPEMIGNGKLDMDCLGAYSGYDGGDFNETGFDFCADQATCDPKCSFQNIKKNNYDPPAGCTCLCVATIDTGLNLGACTKSASDGICDDQCNFNHFDWDFGDCCTTRSLGQCRDPSSPRRSWRTIPELKAAATEGSDPASSMNQYIVSINPEISIDGAATFPWVPETFTSLGGVYFDKNSWGTGSITPAHEYGHAFGLYHPHVGVTDLLGMVQSLQNTGVWVSGPNCDALRINGSQVCFENRPQNFRDGSSDWTGDFCSDTRPSTDHFLCSDPDPSCANAAKCTDCVSGLPWVNTNYDNIMGYADYRYCANRGIIMSFTPQQVGRMRCYIDLKYQSWTHSVNPAPVVMAPNATVTADGVVLSWFRSIRGGTAGDDAIRYEIVRSPSFQGSVEPVRDTRFVDTHTVPGVMYTYYVATVTPNGKAKLSPASNPALLPPVDKDAKWFALVEEYNVAFDQWKKDVAASCGTELNF